jgi:hypothetical protein
MHLVKSIWYLRVLLEKNYSLELHLRIKNVVGNVNVEADFFSMGILPKEYRFLNVESLITVLQLSFVQNSRNLSVLQLKVKKKKQQIIEEKIEKKKILIASQPCRRTTGSPGTGYCCRGTALRSRKSLLQASQQLLKTNPARLSITRRGQ